MTLSHRLFFLSAVLCAYSISHAARPAAAVACFAIVAGRKTTADGSVLVGHNEQNLAPCLISFDRVPRQPIETAIAEKYRYRGGGQRPPETAAYLWSQCIAKDAADSFLNEYGVAVVSDKCPSREDEIDVLVERGEIRDGGVGYLLRRLVAQQATTAREGVLIAGELIERFGYTGTGRTYVIADPNEAWLMAIVRGRRWVAQRVPDDAVVVLPNVYIIREVDLSDTANFLASPDLIDYAVGRGWYDPATDGAFDFRRVYRDPFKPGEPIKNEQAGKPVGVASGNGKSGEIAPGDGTPGDGSAHSDPPDPRRWWAHQLVTSRTIAWPPAAPLPLCIEPSRPMTVAMMAEMLRDRGGLKPLSADTTVEAAVMQLRADMPREIGCVYWRITCEPSSSG
ncbi:MAG: hypothetical protein GX621_18115, partial [Pirellulaceae bacterium]|nr:hypothetical protein [Pirellulaceae bacterium]